MKIVHNGKGYAALLKHAALQADIERRAAGIAAAAGDGYEVTVSPRRVRAGAGVTTTDAKSRRDNSANNTLVRSIDAGR